MTRPNFFIAGAPKCGTTALNVYLRSHPNIFMSTPKELNYFSEDISDSLRHAKSPDQYLNFYKDCKPEHLAVGDASPIYLSSPVAINNIHKFDKNAKIILMLRNPVDLAYSLHSQLMVNFTENEGDFEKAWNLQDSRRMGRHIPKTCNIPPLLQYSKVCRLGDQVERVLKIFSPEQVLVILFDEFNTSTQTIYEEVLAFLEVPSDGRSSFPRVNESKTIKRWWLGYFYERLSRIKPLNSLANFAKKSLVLKDLGIRGKFQGTVLKKRPPLRPEFRAELVNEFREDVEKLSRIIGKDLSHWHQ